MPNVYPAEFSVSLSGYLVSFYCLWGTFTPMLKCLGRHSLHMSSFQNKVSQTYSHVLYYFPFEMFGCISSLTERLFKKPNYGPKGRPPALNWTELNWTELNWTELNWTELNWTELNWTELNWTELNWTELNWTELNWTELNWTELNRTEPNRTQLNWTELNWTETGRRSILRLH